MVLTCCLLPYTLNLGLRTRPEVQPDAVVGGRPFFPVVVTEVFLRGISKQADSGSVLDKAFVGGC